MAKQGSTLAGLTEALGVAASIGLQHGVPLQTLVSQFVSLRFDPSGHTDDVEIPVATSILDYVFRRLALDYDGRDQRAPDVSVSSGRERLPRGVQVSAR